MKEVQIKEELLLDFLHSYIASNGYAPSTREMAKALEFRSVESIHRLLRTLRDQGRVTWEPRKARTLRVL